MSLSDIDQHFTNDELSAVERGVLDVVLEANQRPFSVSGNYARQNAVLVATAASMGFVSTKIMGTVYGRHWQPTALGLRWINQQET